MVYEGVKIPRFKNAKCVEEDAEFKDKKIIKIGRTFIK